MQSRHLAYNFRRRLIGDIPRRRLRRALDDDPLYALVDDIFRHTYATWMRREAGLDTKGLVATGAWRDRKSADRYEHVVVSEEARKAALLPTPDRKRA
jgi:hypothetical protein